MVNKAETNINGLTFGGKAIPLAGFSSTMYIQNRRDSSKFKGCSPLKKCSGLISLKPAIAYFAYTKRYQQA